MGETAVHKSNDSIPEELKYIPVPYISLIGLNAQNDANHAMIWNSFTVNRDRDRPPLYFKLLSDKHAFIASKPKKSSYEWHIPKGILKTNWLQKHLFEIPSVCVLFVDLNWYDLDWNARRTECVAKVEYLRRTLNNRNTRITLVLIQDSSTPPSDDALVTERAALLCSSCDLNAKSLFVLPVSDVSQIMGYILRMETALSELAKLYYQHECKVVKAHREQLNKTTHQLLYVRHQFKIAFFSELKQDPNTALKHYKNSYANLMEVRVTTTNLNEIKTIGGFINYKICKLCFQLNTPLEAISQFRKHIDIFRNKSEPKEIEFEHSAWLSMQYSLFGELFNFAIETGLVPTPMQNPGYYYYEASLQTMQRKKFCHLLCTDTQFDCLSPENLELFNSVLEPTLPTEFFGQRSWRPGLQTLEPLDSEKEKIGIKALKYKELTTVNHSALIVILLSNAINQFKKYKCPRMKRYLMVLVAEEYFSSKDYNNALTFLNNVLPQYRHECWQLLVQKILNTALQSAYLSADVNNFVKLGFECICSCNQFSAEDIVSIQESIQNVMRRQLPLFLSFIDPIESETALKLWSNVLQTSQPIVFTLKMDSFLKFIECKPKFIANSFHLNESIKLDLYLQSNCPNPISLTKLNVLLSNQHYNQYCDISFDTTNDNHLILMPSKLQKFSFELIPLSEDMDRSLTIIGVNATLGSEFVSLVIQWSFCSESSEFVRHSNSNQSDVTHIDKVSQQLVTSIVKPIPKLQINVTHNSPALLNEFYLTAVSIKNKEDFDITNVKISVKFFDSNSDEINIGSQPLIWADSQFIALTESHSLTNIKVDQQINEEIVFKLENLENYTIVLSVNYESKFEIDGQFRQISLSATEKISIDVVIPFVISSELLNLSSGKATQVRLSEPFFLNVITRQDTDIPIDIIELNPQFHPSINCLSECKNPLKNEILIDQTFKIMGSEEHSEPLSLGLYCIKWKRRNTLESTSSKIMISETSTTLPMTSLLRSPIFVDLKCPEVCLARSPVILRYNIYNRLDTDLSLEISMGTSDNFMYSGNKLVQCVVSGRQMVEQDYILYPLVCGSILLPKFRIVMNPESISATAVDYIDQIIPNHLLVFVSDLMNS